MHENAPGLKCVTEPSAAWEHTDFGCLVSAKSGWDCRSCGAEGMRMARRKRGLPLRGEWSSVLFLSRHIWLSGACATCDWGLRCKWDGNGRKDVRPASAGINWGEPGRYLDALGGKDCQRNGKGISFVTSPSLLAIGGREPRYGQMQMQSYCQWELLCLTSLFSNGPKLHGNCTTSHPCRTNCD